MSHYERLARNPMTYDFGFDNGESEELIILGWLNYLEHSFDLVMIMEHFDESLILLKVSNISDLKYSGLLKIRTFMFSSKGLVLKIRTYDLADMKIFKILGAEA